MPKASDKKRWDDLHAALEKADAELEELESKLRMKYGMNYQRSWVGRGDQTRLDKLWEKADKIRKKIYEMVERLSPRDWGHGAPSWWVCHKLTWEDMIRPKNEPLSVVVPGSRGYPDGYVKEQTMAEYQGWANWETWNVALWLGNDEGLYRQAVREAQSRDGFDADEAEDFVVDALPDGTPDFKSPDQYEQVDWQAIADDINEMAGIEEEEEPEEEEPIDDEEEGFSDEEMAEGYVISDARRGGYDVAHEHKHVGHYSDMDDAVKAIGAEMKRKNFYPDIYYVNDHGNVSLLDKDGNEIDSRV